MKKIIILLFLLLTACSQSETVKKESSILDKYIVQGYDFEVDGWSEQMDNLTVYFGRKHGNSSNKWVILYNSKEFGPFVNEYDWSERKPRITRDKEGNLVLVVYDKENWLVITEDNIETFDGGIPYNMGSAKPKGVYFVGMLGNNFVINGYRDEKLILLVNGDRFAQEYEEVWRPFLFDRKIAFSARNNTRHFCVINKTPVVESGGYAFFRNNICSTRDFGDCIIRAQDDSYTAECEKE
jgi:hypothetical protein